MTPLTFWVVSCVLCIQGSSAISLTSIQYILVEPLPQAVTIKIVSRYCLISPVEAPCRLAPYIIFGVISYKKFCRHSTSLISLSWVAFCVYTAPVLWLLQSELWASSITVIYLSDFPLCLVSSLSIMAWCFQYLTPSSWVLNSVSVFGLKEWLVKEIKAARSLPRK